MYKGLIPLLAILMVVPAMNVAAQTNAVKPGQQRPEAAYLLRKQQILTLPNQLRMPVASNTAAATSKQVKAMPLPNSALPEEVQTICYDTSSRYYFKSDSAELYSYTPVATRDGNLLVSGLYSLRNNSNKDGAYLMKMDYRGNILWCKVYDSTNHLGYSTINFNHITELADGTLMLGGVTNDLVTQNYNLLLMHTDANGNILWHQSYKSRVWTPGHGSSDYFYIQQMKQDPYNTGSLYVCGPFWADGRPLLKIDIATGNIVWSNLYQYNGSMFDIPFGIDIRPDEIRYFGKFYTYSNTFVNIIRINKITGDTIATKMIMVSDTAGNKAELLSADRLTVKTNGNYLLGGSCYGYYLYPWNGVTPLYQGSVVEIDSNLNFVRAHAIRSAVESNMYDNNFTFFPDGSGLFTYVHAQSNNPYITDQYYIQFKDGQILRRRKRVQQNEWYSFVNPALRTPDGGDLLCHILGKPAPDESYNEVITLHLSDTASECLGWNDSLTFIQPVNYTTYSWRPDLVGYNVFSAVPNKTITASNHTPYFIPGCTVVSHCDSVSIKAVPAAACPGEPVIITVRKNKECGTDAPLLYNTSGVQSVTRLSDSTWQFLFTGGWSGYISTQVQGCSMLKDSVYIHVSATAPVLNLGPDTTLCAGNTIVLRAGSGFASYEWQDGSTDSLFTVTQPGVYYVTVNSSCSGELTDTVTVIPRPPVPLSLGSDRTMCSRDTVHLNAPAGFLNYTWQPDYYISSTTAQNVVVSPAADTVYTIKAEKTPGCFGFDTVRITVNQSPPISLGNDKSFCSGDSAVLNAGSGFSQYLWNNGSTAQQIAVYTQGTYSVTGTTAQGCISKDTLRVIQVFTLPVVALNPDSTLCSGTTRILDAGSGYVSYQWNDGSITQNISVSGTGLYAVQVIDGNGCKGADTALITRLLPLPSGYLGPDTSICSYGDLQLKALNSYSHYLWSNGGSTSSVTVTKPGLYWLQVTDRNNCTGKDSIIVNPKECLKGFYMPTGFTPNNDGKNDILKPILLGNILQYRFWIYNRWGQPVFETSNPEKGWNGIFKGAIQDGNVFVWVCNYQLEGEPQKTARGTVAIIR